MRGTSKAFGSNADKRFGVYKLNEITAYILKNEWFINPGQAEFLTPGTYTWICPDGVSSVSAVCVGAGGGGGQQWANSAGSGGGLGWKNNIPVASGNSYTVVVGTGGNKSGNTNGTNSYFIDLNTVAGYGGGNSSSGYQTYGPNSNSTYGGGWTGDGGGAGGYANYQGGGGAGGYSGNGGNTGSDATTSSGAGAGGGYYSSTYGTGAGGGVGIYGIRTDYNAQYGYAYGTMNNNKGSDYLWLPNYSGLGGRGGSYRTGTISGQTTGYHGCSGENPWGFSNTGGAIQGGFPGGGSGGPGTSYGGGRGGDGAVRLIWSGEAVGVGRAYPSTLVEDIVV